MTLTDVFIIYLAFGAPLAVYKYLQSRGTNIRRRILLSSFTFLFWVPAAVEIGYLYLTNAYSGGEFVSRKNSDAENRRLTDSRESLTADLARLVRSSNLHDVREAVERYVGLANAVRNTWFPKAGRHEFFEAAGRARYGLGRICLNRRNRSRLERHHIQARRDFVNLFEQIALGGGSSRVITKACDLAWQLEDEITVDELGALQLKRGEVWKSEPQEQSQAIAPVSQMVMTASLNSD